MLVKTKLTQFGAESNLHDWIQNQNKTNAEKQSMKQSTISIYFKKELPKPSLPSLSSLPSQPSLPSQIPSNTSSVAVANLPLHQPEIKTVKTIYSDKLRQEIKSALKERSVYVDCNHRIPRSTLYN